MNDDEPAAPKQLGFGYVEPAPKPAKSKPPDLRVVDADGEVLAGGCPNCQLREDEIAGLQSTIRSQAATLAQLRRDKLAQAMRSGLWPDAMEAFAYWKAQTKHKASTWTVQRFDLVSPFLKSDGLDVVKLAITGAAFDPYKADKRNRAGRVVVYDGWETIFRSRDTFDAHIAKAPRKAVDRVLRAGLKIDPDELRRKAEVILAMMDADGRPLAVRADDAVTKAAAEIGVNAPWKSTTALQTVGSIVYDREVRQNGKSPDERQRMEKDVTVTETEQTETEVTPADPPDTGNGEGEGNGEGNGEGDQAS